MNCSTMSDKSRVCLTLAERRIVILESEKGVSARKLANMFMCGKTQINNIIKNKGDVLREWEANRHSGVKRKRKCKYGQVNDFVYEWFKCARAKNLPVSGPMLQEIARQQAKYLNLDDFTGSNGWLESFRKKHHISFRSICGEGRDISVCTVDEWKNRLSYIFATCKPKDIYNVDEIGIFYKTIPSKIWASKIEECNGGKIMKDRITILFCCNSLGDKEPPLVIGNSQKPRCFKNVDMDLLEVKWYTNKKAWMTSAIFEEWLEEFNSKMLRQNRNVILLLDKAPCHPEIQLSNVNLLFLPTETSHLQPLSQGIIQTLKFHYRERLLRSLLAQTNDAAECMSELIKKVNVGDAVSWIKSAWNAVKDDTIHQCFRKHENEWSEPALQIDPEAQIEELQHLANALGTIYDVAADLEDIPCFDNLEGDWESRLQEYCRGAVIPEETESDEGSDRLQNVAASLETVCVPEIKQEEVSCSDDIGDGESLLQDEGRGEMVSKENESDKESDRLQNVSVGLETIDVPEVKQEEVSCFDDFDGDGERVLQDEGRGEMISEENDSDKERLILQDLSESAKSDYIAEIKQKKVLCNGDLGSERPLQDDYRGAMVSEEIAFDRKSDRNNCQTLPSLKEGISVLQKLQPLCRALDDQYGENTSSGLNKLLEIFEACLVKESCCELQKQTT